MDRAELLQERYRNEPWKLLVCCILLNRTTRTQVDRVEGALFDAYPSPEALSDAGPELELLIAPLGFKTVRAERLRRFSSDWLEITFDYGERPPVRMVSRCYGLGFYALDSYKIFVLGHIPKHVISKDKELIAYIERNRS